MNEEDFRRQTQDHKRRHNYQLQKNSRHFSHLATSNKEPTSNA